MKKKVLERGIGDKAKAFILLTNKNSAVASREDYRNILIALAIKKYHYINLLIKNVINILI